MFFEAEVVARLASLSLDRLALLTSQLGARPEYTTILDQINDQLDNQEVQRAVLGLLFAQLEEIIDVGPCSYFWHGCLDRWFELVFWTIIGTLVFLLNEIKKYYPQPYKKNRWFHKLPLVHSECISRPFYRLSDLTGLVQHLHRRNRCYH